MSEFHKNDQGVNVDANITAVWLAEVACDDATHRRRDAAAEFLKS